METSNAARSFMIVLLFMLSCFIIIMNLRNIFRLTFNMSVSRLSLIVWSLLGLFFAYCVVDMFYIEPTWVKIEHNTITTSKLPQGARFRIVQLSDLHMEQFGKRERRMIYLTAMAQPDIIVLTGDYVNTDNNPKCGELLEDVGRRLCDIAPTYAVEGNWDSNVHMASLERGGVKILNDWTEIKGKGAARIALVGYLWSGNRYRKPCPREMEPDYKALLCHTSYLQGVGSSWMDLALTGHTHGGQLRVPIFGALLPDQCLVGKYQKGLYQYKQGKLYVNSGIGMEGGAPQVRFFCRPIVAVIDIVGKKE
ncbi:MAG: metallophosphoesterase [Armatimonadetes bacterium]|nr:metallophosphoesterase [Armatimonadota bacterium]